MLVSRLAIVVALASAALFACAQSVGHPRAFVSDSREVPTSALGSMTSVRVTFHHDGSTPNAAIVFLHGVGGSETTWSELRGSESVAAPLRESQGPSLNILVVAVAGERFGERGDPVAIGTASTTRQKHRGRASVAGRRTTH